MRSLIHRCRTNITTLIDQNEKRLTFPELFTPVLPSEKSPFHWNLDKFTKRDLLELLTALCHAEAIVDDRGKPATYERWYTIGVGQMGLHPDVFESLTPAEFSYAWLGWVKRERERERERQDWERERWSVWVLTSIQLECKNQKPMVEMFPMQWDNAPPTI